MNLLGLIPARGDSKRLPNKNIRPLLGKPLIAYTVEAALHSGVLDRVLLTTDSPDIATVGQRFGAEAPFMRPPELARDDSPTSLCVLHALDQLADEGYRPDAVCLLQPTSPLRTADDVRAAAALFDPDACDAVYSVCEASCPPWWMWACEDGLLRAIVPPPGGSKQRHDLPTAYEPNGAIYLSRVEIYERPEQSAATSKKIRPYVMDRRRSIDIDDELDWIVAETLLSREQP